MFTGIVEEMGRVVAFTSGRDAWRLQIAAEVTLSGAAMGDSMAVNGCCLTIASYDERSCAFDVLEETRRLTNFSALQPASRVNLERSLRFDGKVGGHFVTGHIDGLGKIEIMELRGKDHYLRIKAPPDSGRYLVNKGSVAVDGVSLTVVDVEADGFAVWLIPHTMKVTNLGARRIGDEVNLEFDVLSKYIEKLAPKLRN